MRVRVNDAARFRRSMPLCGVQPVCPAALLTDATACRSLLSTATQAKRACARAPARRLPAAPAAAMRAPLALLALCLVSLVPRDARCFEQPTGSDLIMYRVYSDPLAVCNDGSPGAAGCGWGSP